MFEERATSDRERLEEVPEGVTRVFEVKETRHCGNVYIFEEMTENG